MTGWMVLALAPVELAIGFAVGTVGARITYGHWLWKKAP